MPSVLVTGEPALWSAGADPRSVTREEQWKCCVKDALQGSQPAPKTILLHFAVREWTRRGHHFDLDNLVTPVFRAIYGNSNRERTDARAALSSWRAVIGQSPAPFLLLDFLDTVVCFDHPSDGRFIIDDTWSGTLPANSRALDYGMPAWVQQHMSGYLPLDSDRFGVQLIFSDSVADLSRPEEKPIKPVIDCLYPMFGGMPGRGEDWKKLYLQVERRPGMEGSCHIRCWLLQKSIESIDANPTLALESRFLTTSFIHHERADFWHAQFPASENVRAQNIFPGNWATTSAIPNSECAFIKHETWSAIRKKFTRRGGQSCNPPPTSDRPTSYFSLLTSHFRAVAIQ